MVENKNKEAFRICIECGGKIYTGKRRWMCDDCKRKKVLARKKEFYRSQYDREPIFEDFSDPRSDVEFNILEEVHFFFYKNEWYWKHKKSKLRSAQGFSSYELCKKDAISAFW